MVRVADVDQVLLLLRERLAHLQRRERASAGANIRTTGESAPLDRLRALKSYDALGDDQRRRAIVQGLLAEEFGDGVAGDAGFQAVLDDVMRIVGEMPGGVDLIDRAGAALRAGAS